MVKVILAAHLSGTRNGIPWPPPGGEIDVPEDEAADLFRNELAVVAPEEAPEEAAVVEGPTERATKPVTKAKFRGK
jgi:hypothetical protein